MKRLPICANGAWTDIAASAMGRFFGFAVSSSINNYPVSVRINGGALPAFGGQGFFKFMCPPKEFWNSLGYQALAFPGIAPTTQVGTIFIAETPQELPYLPDYYPLPQPTAGMTATFTAVQLTALAKDICTPNILRREVIIQNTGPNNIEIFPIPRTAHIIAMNGLGTILYAGGDTKVIATKGYICGVCPVLQVTPLDTKVWENLDQ